MSATSLLLQPFQRQVSRPRIVINNSPPTPLTPPTMPLLTRESLAHRFRQNWLAKHPSDLPQSTTTQVDDSLTSLNWLQNLNIMKMASPTPPASPEPAAAAAQLVAESAAMNTSGDLRVDPNAVLNMTHTAPPGLHTKASGEMINGGFSASSVSLSPPQLNCKLTAGLDVAPPTPTTPTMDKIDYKSNPYVKPPHSYATLICMAMRESKKNKITLSGIYNWITDNFMYYRVADPSWQNSIRHNLSLNKCFQKVPRRKDEPGKGGFWRINPEHSDMFVNGIFKKRRSTGRETITGPPFKKVKRESETELATSALTAAVAGLSGHPVGVSAGLTTSSSTNSSPSSSLSGRQEQTPEEKAQLRLAPAEDTNETLRGDFNWNAILYQDIEVGGVSIRTEDIIDAEKLENEDTARPILDLSPPPSDSNSDAGLEDLLNCIDDPLDLSKSAPDLTIQGASISPPEWWNDTMSDDVLQRGLMSPDHLLKDHGQPSGLNTPLAPSPAHEPDTDFSHPWAESRAELDEAIASFDFDLQKLFDEDLTGGVMLN